MADDRHLEKSKNGYLHNDLTSWHKIWQDDAY